MRRSAIRTDTKEMPERLKRIFQWFNSYHRYLKYADEPVDTAIEQRMTWPKNPDSALKLGQARGVAIAAMVALDPEVSEYTARATNQTSESAADGAAAKELKVQDMVCRISDSLEVRLRSKTPLTALACAICHATHSHLPMNKLILNSALRGRSSL